MDGNFIVASALNYAIPRAIVWWNVDSSDDDAAFVLTGESDHALYDGRMYSHNRSRIQVADLSTGMRIRTLYLPPWADDIDVTADDSMAVTDNAIFTQHSYGYVQQWSADLDRSMFNYTCDEGTTHLATASGERLYTACLVGWNPEYLSIDVWDATSGNKMRSYTLGCPRDGNIVQYDGEYFYCLQNGTMAMISIDTGKIARSYRCDLEPEPIIWFDVCPICVHHNEQQCWRLQG